jgi:ribosomal protein L18E
MQFEGKTIKAGGKEWIIPALTFKQLKRLRDKLSKLSIKSNGIPEPEQLDVIVEVVHASLSRNYPEVTLEEVEDMIDMDNVLTVLGAVMGQSGLVQAQSGEAKAAR